MLVIVDLIVLLAKQIPNSLDINENEN